jgi:hypothetical protein
LLRTLKNDPGVRNHHERLGRCWVWVGKLTGSRDGDFP